MEMDLNFHIHSNTKSVVNRTLNGRYLFSECYCLFKLFLHTWLALHIELPRWNVFSPDDSN